MLRIALALAILALQPDPSERFDITFEGAVLDEDGHPIPEADVRIVGPGLTLETATDRQGRFRLAAEVSVGEYTVAARAPGFSIGRERVTIGPERPGPILRVELRLREELLTTAPPPPPPPPPPPTPPAPPPPPQR